MDLRKLLEGFLGENVDITGITTDSRQVKPGYLFVGLPSLTGKDINPFIKEALENGAVAVVCTPDLRNVPDYDAVPINFISSDNPRKDLACIAAKFYTEKPENLVAVTGTNGKSSVVEFVRQFWEAEALKGATVGTIGVFGEQGEHLLDESLTSPDTVYLHEILKVLYRKGYTHTALEASSHGLDQYRVHNLPLKAAGFTSLSQDHLDYHHDLERYFEAKAKLFREVLPEGGTAVLNADAEQFGTLKSICEHRNIKVMSYGNNGEDLKIISNTPEHHGQSVRLEIQGEPHEFLFPLIGDFQLMNALCAAGLAMSTGITSNTAVNTLKTLKGVVGRLQFVGTTKVGAKVYVDYAHTPDALTHVLKTIRPHTKGKLKVIFGCGGNRDTLKRPLMGKVASDLADSIIVTDDNPRFENPAAIRREVMQTCPQAEDIEDREKAIKIGIKSLAAGDILVVAGKGHETGQIIGDTAHPFDDVKIVQKYINEDPV